MPRKRIYPLKSSTETTQRVFYFWATAEDKLSNFDEWYESSLVSKEQEDLSRLLRLLATTAGPRLHHSEKKFKHEFDKISAIKCFQIRLYGVLEGNNYVVLRFTKKKTDKLSKNEKKIIEDRYEAYLKLRD